MRRTTFYYFCTVIFFCFICYSALAVSAPLTTESVTPNQLAVGTTDFAVHAFLKL